MSSSLNIVFMIVPTHCGVGFYEECGNACGGTLKDSTDWASAVSFSSFVQSRATLLMEALRLSTNCFRLESYW